jgi:dephospho-CoA kinase
MANQMDEDEKMSRCDYVINNYGSHAIIPQVLDLHNTLLENAKTI